MKKILAIFLSLLMVLGVCSSVLVSVNAAEETKNYPGCLVTVGGVEYCVKADEEIGDGVIIVSYESSGIKKVTIPSKIEMKCCEVDGCKYCQGVGSYEGTVIGIEKNAFKNKTDIVEIVVPETVFYIGASAFSGCSNLTSIDLAREVKTGFSENENEFTTSLPDGNTEEKAPALSEIPKSAFSGCISLTDITIPETVKVVHESAFYNCASLAKIWVEGELTLIGKNAFNGCKSLITITGPHHPYKTGVSFPQTVEEIGQGAFSGCKSIYAMYIPKGITVIDKSCFSNCTSLNVLEIPDNVKVIEESAFQGCTSLPEVRVPNSVEEINKNAFLSCTSLQTAVFPEGLTKLSDSVLSGCKNLKNFKIPKSVVVIESNALKNCASLTELSVPTGVNGVYIIGSSAFYGCAELKSINIPTELTTINSSVFSGCKSLAKIEIPNSITNIGASAFQNCDALTSVKIPDSVINIRESAFSGCDALESVTISKNCETIGVNAFSNCKMLKKVTIPNSVKVLGSGAFLSCKSLQEVVVDADLSAIATNTFYGTPEGCVFKCKCGTYAFDFAKEMGYNTQCIAHSNVKWVTTKTATVYKSGLKEQKCIDCGFVLKSEVVPQLKCSEPTLSSVSNTTSGVKVSWSKVSGADRYRVYRKTSSSGWTCLNYKVTSTSYTDTSAKSGTKYYYTVRAENEAGLSSYNSTGLSIKRLSTPKLSNKENTTSGVKITWGKVTGASGYIVYRKTSGGSWKELGKTSKTYYTDKTAKSGTTYYYTVRAYSGSVKSYYDTTGLKIKHLADPTLNTPTSTKNGVSLKWSKVTGAEGYMVYRKTANGSYSRIATVKGSTKVTYTDKSAKKGTKYTYKVKAYYSNTYSAYSNGKTITDKY